MPSVKFDIEVNGSELSRSLSTAEKNMKSLGSAGDQLNAKLSGAAGAAQALTSAVGSKELIKAPKDIASSWASAADRIIAARKATEAQTRATKEAAQAAADLERRQARYNRQSEQIAAAQQKLRGNSLLGQAGAQLRNVSSKNLIAGTIAAIAAGGTTAMAAYDARATDSRVNNAIFGTGAGSIIEANSNRFAQRYGYSSADYRDQMAQLGRGGLGLDKTRALLESYIIAFQGDTEKVNSAIENSLETMSTGIVTEEFLTKMEESGLAIRKALREKYGTNDAELQKLISSGAISFEEITQSVSRMTDAGTLARKTYEEQVEATASSLKKLKEGWTQLFSLLGKGLNDLLNGPLKKVLSFINPANWIADDGSNMKMISYDEIYDPSSPYYNAQAAEKKRLADATNAELVSKKRNQNAQRVDPMSLLNTYAPGTESFDASRIAEVEQKLSRARSINQRLEEAKKLRASFLDQGIDIDNLSEAELQRLGNPITQGSKIASLSQALRGTSQSLTFSRRLQALETQRNVALEGITQQEARAAEQTRQERLRNEEAARKEAAARAAEEEARAAEKRAREERAAAEAAAQQRAAQKARTSAQQNIELSSLKLSGDTDAYMEKRREIEYNNNYNNLIKAGLGEEEARRLAAQQAAISSLSSAPGDDNRNPLRSAQRVGTSLASVGGGRSVNVIQAQQVSYAKKSAISLDQIAKTTNEILSTTKATRYATVS